MAFPGVCVRGIIWCRVVHKEGIYVLIRGDLVTVVHMSLGILSLAYIVYMTLHIQGTHSALDDNLI